MEPADNAFAPINLLRCKQAETQQSIRKAIITKLLTKQSALPIQLAVLSSRVTVSHFPRRGAIGTFVFSHDELGSPHECRTLVPICMNSDGVSHFRIGVDLVPDAEGQAKLYGVTFYSEQWPM